MEFELNSELESTKNTSNYDQVPVLNNNNILYSDFFEKIIKNNFPCIIENVTETWEANTKWINDTKEPNLPYLKTNYGKCKITIYNCKKKYYNSQETETCSFENFLENYWGKHSGKYLKDWHLKNEQKDDNFYQVPIYFASDWLNEYLVEKNSDDYRFVYMGQAGTWTPFHADVFGSFSWSANVCGRKKWILLPPGEENLLRDSLNNLPYDISEIYQKVKHFELVQNAGEAIFVPSGWHHQVHNLQDTISVNHNWFNGCNILKIWLNMSETLENVKKEIEDCKEMENFTSHCQIMLKASFGMDFSTFFDIIQTIGTKRTEFLANNQKHALFHGHRLGRNHAKFDLDAIRSVIKEFSQHCDLKELFLEEKVDTFSHYLKSNI